MNKPEFISHIASKHNCTKIEAEKIINIFTSSVTSALGKGEEVSLIGFGNFSISRIEVRTERNPKTAESLKMVMHPIFWT